MKVYHSTASEIIGFRKFRISSRGLQMRLSKCLKTKLQHARDTTYDERKRLQGVFRAKAKEDRERYYNNLADEMEEGLLRNDLHPAYGAVRHMKGSSTAHITPVRKKDGSPCNSHEELLSRWTEHYSEALNHPTAVPCPELNRQQSQAVDDPEVSVAAPTLDEVRAAIKKLKFGRATGRDAIAPEMLKLAIDPTSRILHQLFASVWATGKQVKSPALGKKA